jgi:hypothetical protein
MASEAGPDHDPFKAAESNKVNANDLMMAAPSTKGIKRK